MPYTSPATVVTGTTITSAWGNSVKAGEDFLANPPACRVRKTSAFSHTSSGNWLPITFDTETYDTDNMHSTVTNTSRITINTAGMYVCGGSFEFAGNVTGNRGLRIYVNSIADAAAFTYGPPAVSPIGTGMAICAVYKFAAADWMELQAYQSSGGTLSITNASLPAFFATWIGTG